MSASALMEDLARAKRCLRSLEKERPTKTVVKYEQGLEQLRGLVLELETQSSQNILAKSELSRVQQSLKAR